MSLNHALLQIKFMNNVGYVGYQLQALNLIVL